MTNHSNRRRRLAWTAAAAAAGGLPAATSATVVHVSVNESYDIYNNLFRLDLDGDEIVDLVTIDTAYSFSHVVLSAQAGTLIEVEPNNAGFPSPRVFEGSDSVSITSTPATTDFATYAPFATLVSPTTAPFGGSTPKFLGLRFNTTDYGLVNGWIRLTVTTRDPDAGDFPPRTGPTMLFVQDYAFETDGGPIHVPNEVPEPSSLLLMASGAAGLLALRRRRKS